MRVFNLQPYQNRQRNTNHVNYVIITQEDTEAAVVQAAWAYALQHTAIGLEMPDYDGAVQLMLERHPSWTAINSGFASIAVDLTKANQDFNEAE